MGRISETVIKMQELAKVRPLGVVVGGGGSLILIHFFPSSSKQNLFGKPMPHPSSSTPILFLDVAALLKASTGLVRHPKARAKGLLPG